MPMVAVILTSSSSKYGLRQRLGDPDGGNTVGVGGVSYLRQNQDELVAAEARDRLVLLFRQQVFHLPLPEEEVALANAGEQTLGNFTQQGVAAVVTEASLIRLKLSTSRKSTARRCR